jgi:2-keto-3-deoxy-L-rhamnonate aldolase RhmA
MQCETRKGVANIDEICKTPGLDCIFIGTFDLSQDLGCMGDFKNPEFVSAVDKVLKVCQANNIVPGIVSGTPEDAAMRIKQGFQVVTIMNDLGFFRNQSKKHIEAVHNIVDVNNTCSK